MSSFTTFTPGQPIQVGHIVLLPSGKAGEVTALEGDIIWVRPWDCSASFDQLAHELQPWVE